LAVVSLDTNTPREVIEKLVLVDRVIVYRSQTLKIFAEVESSGRSACFPVEYVLQIVPSSQPFLFLVSTCFSSFICMRLMLHNFLSASIVW
jgi:hypothetical protein